MPALINVSGVLSDPAYRQPFEFVNASGSYDTDTGLWSGDSVNRIVAYGSIQPVSRNELHEIADLLGGGFRVRSAIIVFTTFDLLAAKNADPRENGSVVYYNNLEWKVIDIEDYSPHGHKECIAIRVDGQID